MATQDQLATSIDQVVNIVTLLTVNPNPTVTINGETIDMSGYFGQLANALPTLLQVKQALGGPYQKVTRMRA